MNLFTLLMASGKRDATRLSHLENAVKFSIRKVICGPNQESVVKFSIYKTEK